MHGPINIKSPNNTSKWQMGFNSAFKGLKIKILNRCELDPCVYDLTLALELNLEEFALTPGTLPICICSM